MGMEDADGHAYGRRQTAESLRKRAENPRPECSGTCTAFDGEQLTAQDPYLSEKPFSRACWTYLTTPRKEYFA